MRAITIILNQTIAGASVALISLFIPFAAMGQDAAPPPPSPDYVSRTEYDKLKAEHEAMKTEMEALKTAVRQMANGTAPAAPAEGPARKASGGESGKQVVSAPSAQAATDELRQEVDTLKTQVKETFPGSTKFLVAGYGTSTFAAKSGEDPFFDATFNAFLLWKLSDRLLVEGEVEWEFEDGSTSTNLEIIQASYLLNDYMTIGVGRFLNPMNFFVERQHMGWVNKFPDKPLAVYDGLLPESDLGVQLRGVVPVGPTKLEYAAFLVNACDLITSFDDPMAVGMLNFDNTSNRYGHFTVGGHVGFIPIPELEVGYGVRRSEVGPRDHAVETILQSVDFNYVRDSALLKGLINVRAQWVWSHVGHFVYDPNGDEGGPFEFNNNRNGGYAQVSYRPTKIDNDIIKNFEAVVRYDRFNQLHTPVGFDEERWSFGLDYWLSPSTVVKAAYEVDNKNGGARDQNSFMLQVATGF
jgi:cell division protein FtsB